MVGCKIICIVLNMFPDPNNGFSMDEPVIITQFNLSKAIKDNSHELPGMWSSLLSEFISSEVCEPSDTNLLFRTSREEYQKVWAVITTEYQRLQKCCLKCDELKFEQYKLLAWYPLTADIHQPMLKCLQKIRVLEH
ncbi:hypothetical protein Pfo_027948 [Paulownia fortunei]|nr:hypothetical protein Pfo_027948 [Paulownia fortunei]